MRRLAFFLGFSALLNACGESNPVLPDAGNPDSAVSDAALTDAGDAGSNSGPFTFTGRSMERTRPMPK